MKKLLPILLVLLISFSFVGCQETQIKEPCDDIINSSLSSEITSETDVIENSEKGETEVSQPETSQSSERDPEVSPVHMIRGSVQYNLDYGTDALQYDDITSIRNYWEIPTSPEAFSKYSSEVCMVLLFNDTELGNRGEVIGSAVSIDEHSKSFFEDYSMITVDRDEITVSILHAFEISDSGKSIPLGVNIEQNRTKDCYYVLKTIFDVSSDYRELNYSHSKIRKVSGNQNFYDGEYIDSLDIAGSGETLTTELLQEQYSGLSFMKNYSEKVLK